MLGFKRPNRPECALAYPNDLREFQQKRPQLCDAVMERELLMRRVGGPPEPLGAVRGAELWPVLRAYYLQ